MFYCCFRSMNSLAFISLHNMQKQTNRPREVRFLSWVTDFTPPSTTWVSDFGHTPSLLQSPTCFVSSLVYIYKMTTMRVLLSLPPWCQLSGGRKDMKRYILITGHRVSPRMAGQQDPSGLLDCFVLILSFVCIASDTESASISGFCTAQRERQGNCLQIFKDSYVGEETG